MKAAFVLCKFHLPIQVEIFCLKEILAVGADKFFWMPAVTVNSARDLAVIFQQSGKNAFLGIAYTGKKATASSLEPFKNLQIGKCNLVNVDGQIGIGAEIMQG